MIDQLIVRIHIIFFYDEQTTSKLRDLIIVFTLICLIFNLFVQLTYLLDRDRFKYPLKAIIRISFCFLMISTINFLVTF